MSGMRVMVVTEHPVFREILTSLIEECGYEVYAAADGIDALRQIYHVLPQVIVSDAALPNLSGFELLPFVRRRFPEIGVIALWEKRCTNEDVASEFADVTVGVDPFNPQLLTEALAGLATEYPFRAAEGSDASNQERPTRQSSVERNICQRCERLQLNASVARMNSLLSSVWRQLRPQDREAENQEADAEVALRQAFSELEKHRRSAHAFPRAEHRALDEQADEESTKFRCANG
jgi:CheY-like chemotaxis protein